MLLEKFIIIAGWHLSEVFIGFFGCFTTPRCAFEVTFLNKEWLINFFYCTESSPTAVAIVVKPTGPPENFSIISLRILLSISSSPCSSTFRAVRPKRAISTLIIPLPLTWAKSRILRRRLLAIRGVPRLRRAISGTVFRYFGI